MIRLFDEYDIKKRFLCQSRLKKLLKGICTNFSMYLHNFTLFETLHNRTFTTHLRQQMQNIEI